MSKYNTNLRTATLVAERLTKIKADCDYAVSRYFEIYGEDICDANTVLRIARLMKHNVKIVKGVWNENGDPIQVAAAKKQS